MPNKLLFSLVIEFFDSLPQINDRSKDRSAVILSAGYGVHSSNCIMISELNFSCSSIDILGSKKTFAPSIGELK